MGKASRNKARNAAAKQMRPTSEPKLVAKVIGIVAVMAIVSMVMISALCLLVYNGKREEAQPQREESSLPVVFDNYLDRHRVFFVKHWCPATLSLAEEISQVKAQEAKIASLLRQYSEVSPLTTQIHKKFTDFQASIFQQGSSRVLSVGPAEGMYGDLEICFIPEDQGSFPGLQRVFTWYRQEWQAVMQRDYVCPDAFMVALLYHEMGHALFDRQGKPSSSASSMSESWIQEEIIMHELEWQILDTASAGRFTRLLDAVICRVPKTPTLKQVIEAISDDDLTEFDQVFSLEQESAQMASVYLAQFEICLLFRAIDVLCPEPVRLSKKVTAYNWAIKRHA